MVEVHKGASTYMASLVKHFAIEMIHSGPYFLACSMVFLKYQWLGLLLRMQQALYCFPSKFSSCFFSLLVSVICSVRGGFPDDHFLNHNWPVIGFKSIKGLLDWDVYKADLCFSLMQIA